MPEAVKINNGVVDGISCPYLVGEQSSSVLPHKSWFSRPIVQNLLLGLDLSIIGARYLGLSDFYQKPTWRVCFEVLFYSCQLKIG